jgi:hypothetical protein
MGSDHVTATSTTPPVGDTVKGYAVTPWLGVAE